MLGIFCSLTLAATPVVAAPFAPAPFARAPFAPVRAAQGKPAVEIRWLEPTEALAVLRRDHRPALFLYRGDGTSPAYEKEAAAALADRKLQRLLGGEYICVALTGDQLSQPYPLIPAPPSKGDAPKKGAEVPGEKTPDKAPDKAKEKRPVEKPGENAEKGPEKEPQKELEEKAPDPKEAPPTLGGKLGIVAPIPDLVVVDFREQVVRRFPEKFPPREILRRELTSLARKLAEQAAAAHRVEKLLEKAEYSYKAGERRAAVLSLVPLDDPKARKDLDDGLAARVLSVITAIRKDAAQAIASGEALERDRRFLDAASAYRQVSWDFPFPDIVKDAVRRQNQAMRKAQTGG